MTDKSAMHILVLDDEPFMLKLLGRILTGLGYTDVLYHESASEALILFNTPESVPDVILLDIKMHGMDGIEFVRHLSERQYTGHLILVSGMEELLLRATEKLARAYNMSVAGVLSKPPTPVELGELLAICSSMPPKKLHEKHKTYDAGALQAAIEKGELVNYYQPKVLVATGELVGVETLVRWQHPEDGLVLPDHFIQVAEANGLINALTHRVLKEALKQARIWYDAGMHLRVAINVSMDDLANVAFGDFVIAAAEEAGVPTELLELEVTERRLMESLLPVLDVLTRLRLKRIRLSIDDFGTGNSSLVQLRDLPFDEIKVDRSFTHHARHNARLKAIFEASLDLANYLNMELAAEGVEDADDWAFMQATGCHIAQGYYIGSPMPADELQKWTLEWLARVSSII